MDPATILTLTIGGLGLLIGAYTGIRQLQSTKMADQQRVGDALAARIAAARVEEQARYTARVLELTDERDVARQAARDERKRADELQALINQIKMGRPQ